MEYYTAPVSKDESDDRSMTQQLRYPIVLFDWGDTVMHDDPGMSAPMVAWETVEAIDDVGDVLAYLHASGRRMVLATSANVSDESQIRGALARCSLDQYFWRVYCFKNTNLPKGEVFYRHILSDLKAPASDVLMVGDHFEKDVQTPNMLSIFAVWFNPQSDETHTSDLHITIRSMPELRKFFESLD